MKRIIVGITGATGSPLAVKLLQFMQDLNIETHLVISQWAKVTLQQEAGISYRQVCELASKTYDIRDQGAAISSGSFITEGMIIVPCSMKTLASIRIGFAENLISRAADVILKERRKLLLVPRETPLSSIHLENMLHLSNLGATIFPPTPAFYNQPESIDALLDHLAVRILDQFQLSHPAAKRWSGMNHDSHQGV
ncbi:MAG: UbiX family flavin prenyltransferase [Enterobacteriaceae bacterium]|jgi:4-hydroxy-3-polyprenylbenzoate decarboxylase|nr:UbiX family flavin prenyltransferase [Enterobacteriaceae bacterium]